MNTPYEKLRKHVYEILYDGNPPFEFGCEVKTLIKNIVFHEVFIGENYAGNPVFKTGFEGVHRTGKIKEIEENLGKPLSLQDFLRAISVTHEFVFGLDGHLMIKIKQYQPEAIAINLSLPISEQTDEVLKKLNALLV